METFFQDLRFGFRVMLRTPVIAISVIAVLALGIGANAAMFGILDAVLLHAVRYPDPQTLVWVWSVDPQGAVTDASPADFLDWRARSKTVTDLSAWMPTTFIVNGGERPRQLGGARVTSNFFRTLRVKPLLGRVFLPDEDGLVHPENAAHSVVISYRLWQEDLGADPNVLGRTIRVDQVPYNVVGVLPQDFQFWWRPHDLWIPVNLKVQERDYRDLVVVGRLTAARNVASIEMNQIARALGEAYPKTDRGWTVQIEDLQERLLNKTSRVRLLLLSSALGLVLLLACTNVASLLLARSAARERELAVRVSLGASGLRLARQLLTESALLGLSGGAIGLGIAWGLIRAIPKFVPAGAIPTRSVELSPTVLWFCLAASLATCLLVGLAPAISAARSEAQAALKDSSRGATAGKRRQRFRQWMVGAEVALALVLLCSAWLMISGFRAVTSVNLGFDSKNVLALRLFLPTARYNAAQSLEFYRLATERIGQIPGVSNVAIATELPLANNNEMFVSFDRDGSGRDPNQRPVAHYASVGVDFHRTLAIPLKRGRLFTTADDEKAPLVAVVNETLASHLFPGQDPLGQRLVVDRPLRGGQETVRIEIVGVVADIHLAYISPETKPMIYVPHRQNPFSRGVWLAVRSGVSPASLTTSVRSVLADIDREQPVEQVGTLDQMLTTQFAQPRFQTQLMGSFALLALVLAAVGIYGVNAYAVTQRRNEIGLRMALGASRGDVLRQVIGQGMLPTGIGIAVGLVAAAGLAVWLKSFLAGVDSPDPVAFLGAALILGTVACVACYFPARRAVRIDPAIALRME